MSGSASNKSSVSLEIQGCTVNFPYIPYDSQVAMMDKTIQALNCSQNVLLELPTGSGKSLSLLCAAAAWVNSMEKQDEEQLQSTDQSEESRLPNCCDLASDRNDEPRSPRSKCQARIYIASRTHSQLAQLIRELRKSKYAPTMCILGSREQYCINRDVMKSASKNEECKSKLRENACGFFHGVQKLTNHRQLSKGGNMEVHDIEDLVGLGKSARGCPYFAARAMAKEAKIIFCPYNYLLDPLIREAMDIDLKGAAVIIDEAHNVEDVCRSAASMEVLYDDLVEACSAWEANQFLEEAAIYTHLEGVARGLAQWLQRESSCLTQQDHNLASRVADGFEAISMFNEVGVRKETLKELNDFLSKALKAVEEAEEAGGGSSVSAAAPPAKALGIMKNILTKASLLFENPTDYMLVVQQRTKWADGRGSRPRLELALCLWCLNPAVAFQSVASDARSIILTSGTLAPLDSFSTELATVFHNTLQTSHVIDTRKQVWVGSVSYGPASVKLNGSFKNQDSATYQDELGVAVWEYCLAIPHGVLCFFPSYSFLEKSVARWKATEQWARISRIKVIVVEPRAGGNGDFDKAMNSFYSAVKCSKVSITSGGQGITGALFLAVCRGKVSEGLDFADENARGVLVVGVPFPNAMDQQVKLKKAYNNIRAQSSPVLNGERWYSLQAFRAINQAIGRCIRHLHDFGSIILIDERYQLQAGLKTNLSKWVRECLVEYPTFQESLRSLKTFFSNDRAGAAPSPPPLPTCAVSVEAVCLDCTVSQLGSGELIGRVVKNVDQASKVGPISANLLDECDATFSSKQKATNVRFLTNAARDMPRPCAELHDMSEMIFPVQSKGEHRISSSAGVENSKDALQAYSKPLQGSAFDAGHHGTVAHCSMSCDAEDAGLPGLQSDSSEVALGSSNLKAIVCSECSVPLTCPLKDTTKDLEPLVGLHCVWQLDHNLLSKEGLQVHRTKLPKELTSERMLAS